MPTALFEKWCHASGVTIQQARAVVAHPDKTEVIDYDQTILQLFAQRLPETRPPSLSLVVAHQYGQRMADLALVVRVFEDFVPSTWKWEPTLVLRRFAERFCCDLVIGSVAKKLFLAENVQLTDQQARRFQFGVRGAPDGSNVILSNLFKLTDERPPVVHCALGMGLIVEPYEQYLRERG